MASSRAPRMPIKRRKASSDSELSTDPVRTFVNDLRALQDTICPSPVERYEVFKRRDNILQLVRKDQLGNDAGKVVVEGTCSDFCSEKERYRRIVQNAVNFYECDESGEAAPELFVTDYSRSAADQEHPLPHELRSPRILQASMNFVLSTMASAPIAQQEAPRWYDFVWSRSRAIRKELTQQKIISPIAVDILEKCCRIHIFAAHEFCEVDAGAFDQKMNTENLSKCLQSLRHMYEDLSKRSIFSESEPEFRSYDVFLNLGDSNILQQVFSLRPEVRVAPAMKLAVKLFLAFNTSNYVQFFRLVKNNCTYLQACLLHRFFFEVRVNALTIITGSYSKKIPTAYLTHLLAFDDDRDTLSFTSQFGIVRHAEDPSCLVIHKDIDLPVPTLRVSRFVTAKNEEALLAVLSGVENPTIVERQHVVDSFDNRGQYLLDPVLNSAIARLESTTSASTKLPRTKTVGVFGTVPKIDEGRRSASPAPSRFVHSPSPSSPPPDSKNFFKPMNPFNLGFKGLQREASLNLPPKPSNPNSAAKPNFSFITSNTAKCPSTHPLSSRQNFSFVSKVPATCDMMEEDEPSCLAAASSFSFKMPEDSLVDQKLKILRESCLKTQRSEEQLSRKRAERAALERAEKASREAKEQAARERQQLEAEEKRLRMQILERERQEHLMKVQEQETIRKIQEQERIVREQEKNRLIQLYIREIWANLFDSFIKETSLAICEKNMRIAREQKQQQFLTAVLPVISSKLINEVVSNSVEVVCSMIYKTCVTDILINLRIISDRILVTRLKLRVRRYAMIWKSAMLVAIAKKRRWERFNKYYTNVSNGIEHEQPAELVYVGRFYADPWTVTKVLDELLIAKTAEHAALNKPIIRQIIHHWRSFAQKRRLEREEKLKYEPLPEFKFGNSRKCMKPFRPQHHCISKVLEV